MNRKKLTIEDIQRIAKILDEPMPKPDRTFLFTEEQIARFENEGMRVDLKGMSIEGIKFQFINWDIA